MRSIRAAMLASTLFGTVCLAGSADGRWIHVRVDDGNGADSHVDLQVPLSLLPAMMPLVRDHVRSAKEAHAGGVRINGTDLDTWWSAIKSSQDGELVTVRDGEDIVRVAKKAGFVLVHVDERGSGGSKVRVKVPVDLVEALVTDGDADPDRLAHALARLPDGDLVTVDDEDSHVRIWVDRTPGATRDDLR